MEAYERESEIDRIPATSTASACATCYATNNQRESDIGCISEPAIKPATTYYLPAFLSSNEGFHRICHQTDPIIEPTRFLVIELAC